MNEHKKPRLCELLGVEVGEEWTVEDGPTVYRIDEDGDLLYQTSDGSWLCAYGRAWVLLSILNGNAKVFRLPRCPRWTETDVAHAKALRTLYPDAEAVEKVGPYYAKIIAALFGADTYIRAELFPSLESGKTARLDEILEAAP